MMLNELALERSTGQCSAPRTTTENSDGTFSFSMASCSAGMFSPEAVTYVEALARYTCVGFNGHAKHHHKVIKVKNNRVLPLRASLEDTNGHTLTNDDVLAAPVIQVVYSPKVVDDVEGQIVDVSDDVMSVGKGKKAMQATEGNLFVFRHDYWAFNLKTSRYSAPGTYYRELSFG